jgi:enterochelin esterase-like enzyme
MGYFNVPEWAYMDFFFKEFIPHIDKSFRTIATKEGRAVAGLSMGGGGAVVYAQNYPDMFGAACSTSGLLDHRSCASILGRFSEGWAVSVAQNSPVSFLRKATPETLAKLRSVRWMVECGDDDWIIYTNLDFFHEMKRVRVPFEFRIRDGRHSWKFWQESLPQILAFSFK